MRFEPVFGRVRGAVGGATVVDSGNAMVLHEGLLAPVRYFPRVDVRMDRLRRNDRRSYCPFRGTASYFDLEVDGALVRDAAWSYEQPYPDSDYVRDYIAFDADRIDDWSLDEQPSKVEGEARPVGPLPRWLIREAWQANSIADLVTRWIEQLESMQLSLIRFALVTRTLHPQLSGAAYRWERGAGLQHIEIDHERLTSSQYLDSPLVPIFEGAGGLRRRLDRDDPDDFPILADIRARGGTDYVAMPLVFSSGQINAVTMATDRDSGFDVADLGMINEVLPLLARLVEVFLEREKSEVLLRTYLGRQTGGRVLDGLVRRGDGHDIHAVIWFCDLRDSSALAASLGRREFLARLNGFFDCVAGAVLDNGGEVLRFIGDAALAIFPIGPEGADPACRRALDAARDASARVAGYNRQRPAGSPEMAFGIGLHIGDVTWGNIGTESRLEFTVVGAAANEAARIESLCKELARPVLVSGEFVSLCPGDFLPLGSWELRGTAHQTGIYAPVFEPEEAER